MQDEEQAGLLFDNKRSQPSSWLVGVASH
jgi:hypothetical protein